MKQIRFNVYSSSKPNDNIQALFDKNGINYLGFLKGNELNRAMQNTDIFIHIESDDDEYIRLVRLSVSTKIPEYLMAYRPTIAFGPKEVASIRLYNHIDSRMVIWSNDEEHKKVGLINAIKMINDNNLRKEIAKRGYDYACANFVREVVAPQFKNKLCQLVEE